MKTGSRLWLGVVGMALTFSAYSAEGASSASADLVSLVNGLERPAGATEDVTRSGLPRFYTYGVLQVMARARSDAGAKEKLELVRANSHRIFDAYISDANEGDRVAQESVSRMYAFGFGTAKDLGQAAAWARKAADQGDPYGMREIGAAYEDGQGISKDLKQAVVWYRKAEAAMDPQTNEASRKYLMQAQAYVADKNFQMAWVALGSALSIAPWSSAARYNFALVNAELGYYEAATREMTIFLGLAPDSPQARNAQDLVYQWEVKIKK